MGRNRSEVVTQSPRHKTLSAAQPAIAVPKPPEFNMQSRAGFGPVAVTHNRPANPRSLGRYLPARTRSLLAASMPLKLRPD